MIEGYKCLFLRVILQSSVMLSTISNENCCMIKELATLEAANTLTHLIHNRADEVNVLWEDLSRLRTKQYRRVE